MTFLRIGKNVKVVPFASKEKAKKFSISAKNKGYTTAIAKRNNVYLVMGKKKKK